MAVLDDEAAEYIATLRATPLEWLVDLILERIEEAEPVSRNTPQGRLEDAGRQLRIIQDTVREALERQREARQELTLLAPQLGLAAVIKQQPNGDWLELTSPERDNAIGQFMVVLDEEIESSLVAVRRREGFTE